jgi:hypothetical protein
LETVMRAALSLALVAIGAVLFASPPPAASAAVSSPSAQADEILTQAKAATGGGAWDKIKGWHERGVIERAGSETTYEIWLDVHRQGMVSQITTAGRWQTRGFDGKAAWVIDASDGTTVDNGEAAVREARRNDYFSAYGFFFPDRFAAKRVYVGGEAVKDVTYDVVRVTPEGGAPMDLWVDRKSHRLMALVDPGQDPPAIAALADFRPVAGVLLPFVVTQKAVGAKAASQRRVIAYDFDPIDPKRFAAPTP